MKKWRYRSRSRRTRIFAIAFASALVAVPAGQAVNVDYTGPQPSASQTVVRPDGPAGVPDAGAVPQNDPAGAVARPDRDGARGAGAPTPPPVVAASDSGAFDWRDAGIGMSVAFGLALVGAATLLATRRQRRGRLLAH